MMQWMSTEKIGKADKVCGKGTTMALETLKVRKETYLIPSLIYNKKWDFAIAYISLDITNET